MSMNLRKAISPILATVIIIAVTLVIAIGVIGWIMGIWGTFGSTESLQIYPDSYINVTNSTVVLHIKNTGTATSKITEIEVVGVTTIKNLDYTLTPGDEKTFTPYDTALGSCTPGTSYQVKVYTAAGNVYSIVVQAK